jgi:hypothetical protein
VLVVHTEVCIQDLRHRIDSRIVLVTLIKILVEADLILVPSHGHRNISTSLGYDATFGVLYVDTATTGKY